MIKITVLLSILVFQIASAQDSISQNKKITTYKYGHNGMELIVTSTKETIIISTFNSKLELKEDIAKKVYNYYKSNNDSTGYPIPPAKNNSSNFNIVYILLHRGVSVNLLFHYLIKL